MKAILAFLIFILLLYIYLAWTQLKKPVYNEPRAMISNDAKPILKPRLACVDKATLSEISHLYNTVKDTVAAEKLAAREVFAGRCRRFREGELAYVVDTASFGAFAKLRLKGDTESFWANADAIER